MITVRAEPVEAQLFDRLRGYEFMNQSTPTASNSARNQHEILVKIGRCGGGQFSMLIDGVQSQ